MPKELFGSYTFDRGTGYSIIDVWVGPKMFRAVVHNNEADGSYLRREIRDRDLQRLLLRAIAIVKGSPGTEPVLVESEGEPFPLRVRTEEDEIKEYAEEFMRTEHGRDLRMRTLFGPELEYGKWPKGEPENVNKDGRN